MPVADVVANLIPEQGQLVQVRHRYWLVEDVAPYQTAPTSPAIHRITLECVDDDRLGDRLDVIWEREVGTQVHDEIGLPTPARWDTADRFRAFLHAITWSTSSVLEGEEIQSPFHAAIEFDDYQLEPVARALVMPRVNLLIADDVGLGKTIEAGLVMQELLARQRIRRILVVCPASLQRQWQEEMQSKFQLRFDIIDRAAIQQLRREYGLHVNPWQSFPRLITSVDFFKREQPLNLFLQLLQQQNGRSPLRDWDLLIVDEAHNVAPSGRKAYVRDSDRTRLMRAIANHFEHRLFLTATPHNGYTESFTALLELLDPLRFSRGPVVNAQQVATVMVRRLKDEIQDSLGHGRFARRRVLPLQVTLTPAEQEQHDLLNEYTASRLARVNWSESLPIRFALTMLKKRLLSSPLAFHNSLETHLRTLGSGEGADPDLVQRLQARAGEDWDDDEAKARHEEDALEESTRFFTELTPEERAWLKRMQANANEQLQQPDSETQLLLRWIADHLHTLEGDWNGERLIIFTEYKDTLAYLHDTLAAQGWETRLMTLIGGMNMSDREQIKAAFQSSPSAHPVRILLATDAAAEGLNLQRHCRYLIHWEIPWNPNRMEQRNGRIDRHGQRATEVFIHHFVYENHEDGRFLQTVVDKVETMRHDLGSVGDIIAAQVEEAMLGRRQQLDLPQKRVSLAKDEARADVLTKQRVRELAQKRLKAQHERALYPDNLRLVLDEALRLQGHPGLVPVDAGELAGKAYRLTDLPPAWRNAETAIRDDKGRLLALVFDHSLARDRSDVVLVHLNHPLMKRAIAVFRGNLWAAGLSHGAELNRAAYRVLPDYLLNAPYVIAYGRLVATSALSQKVHEAIVAVGAEIDAADLIPADPELLQTLLRERGEQLPLPKQVAGRLRALFPAHERRLRDLLAAEETRAQKEVRRLLRDKGREEAKAIRALTRDRIRELEKRLTEREQEAAYYQLALPGLEDERQQFQDDTEWLRRKLAHLRGELDSEPERIKQRYTLRSARVFPLGLLYILPAKTVKIK